MKILKYLLILAVFGLVLFLILQTKNKNTVFIPPQNIDVTIKQNVENYLRNNISILSPIQPVLGGTWYIVSVTIDLSKNSGLVTYEDGHIQEIKNFLYTTNEKGEVVNLTILSE